MKRIFFILTFSFCLLWLGGCRTKNITSNIEKEQLQNDEKLLEKIHLLTQQFSEKQESQTQYEELKTLISQLGISYKGNSLEDKLDIFLKKTEDGGRQLTFQGKGEANYSENMKNEFRSMQEQIYKRQDSLFSVLFDHLKEYEYQQAKSQFSKQKQVKVQGFTFGIYFWILILIIGAFIAWKYKLFRWFK